MNIAVDLRALGGENISGVKVYLQNLLEEIFRLDKKNRYFLWFNSATEDFPQNLKIPKSPRFKKIQTRFSNRILNLQFLASRKFADELILAAENRPEKIDLFWLPDPRPIALSPNCRLVMTIHDLASELFPEFFSLKTRLWHKFINPRKIANSADRILAVSNFTKDELGRVWQIPAEKISVTSLAAKVSRSRFSPKNLPPKFVLALSTLEPRKNLRTLIAAFAEFQKENSTEIELLIAGDFDSKIFADPKIPKIQGVRFLGKISEAEKFQLLAAAEVFCFPSIYEGFGIPPLEAMQCGTPVLAADIPAIREVCGEAAKFIPPKNVDAWKVALAKILTNAELRKNLSKRGLARAGRFSWEETARKTIEVFNNLVI